jgi:hypothetical protein
VEAALLPDYGVHTYTSRHSYANTALPARIAGVEPRRYVGCWLVLMIDRYTTVLDDDDVEEKEEREG